jgi:hypothetical protein
VVTSDNAKYVQTKLPSILTMAHRIPLELLHEIILINDDDVDFKTGKMGGYGPTGPPALTRYHSYEHPRITLYFTPRAPKYCAKAIGLVCQHWNFFVRQSPRLWVSRVTVSLGKDDRTKTDILAKIGKIFRDCDLDIQISCCRSINLTDFVQILASIATQWRSLFIQTSSLDLWLQFQAACPTLPRLVSLCCAIKIPEYYHPIGMHMPQLRYLQIEHALLKPTSHLVIFGSSLTTLSLKGVSFDAGFAAVVTQMQLLSALPHLQQLAIEESESGVALDGHQSMPFPPSSERPASLSSARMKVSSVLFHVFLHAFRIDKLRELSLRILGHRNGPDAAINLPALDAPSLLNLELSINPLDLSLLDASASLPSLDVLDIDLKSPIDHFGQDLAPRPLQIGVSFPKLRRLSIKARRPLPFARYLGGLDAPMLESIDLRNISTPHFYRALGNPFTPFLHLKQAKLFCDDIPCRILEVLTELDLPRLEDLDIDIAAHEPYDLSFSTQEEERLRFNHLFSRIKAIRLRLREQLDLLKLLVNEMSQVKRLRITLEPSQTTQLAELASFDSSLVLPKLSRLAIIKGTGNYDADSLQEMLDAVENMLKVRAQLHATPLELTISDLDSDRIEVREFVNRSRQYLVTDVIYTWSNSLRRRKAK